MYPSVHAHQASYDLQSEILVPAYPKAHQGKGPGGVEAQGYGHLEDQDFHRLVPLHRVQAGVGFFGCVDHDLIPPEAKVRQRGYGIFFRIRAGIYLD